jgi:glycosyltransferase involved in cell wall biosynthesis
LKVAIIIPCKNEKEYISKCLDSVIAADYPENLKQVFVCDGKSMDGSDKIVQEYGLRFPNIHLLINEHETTPYALNLGIEKSDADILIILGAHAEIFPDYIRKCIECFNTERSIGCVGGFMESIYENETAEIISTAMSSSFGVGSAYFRTGAKIGYVDTVAFGAYKREVFAKAGLFDTDLTRNQDDEFNYRVIKSGFRIYLSGKIKSKYYVRSSFNKLFRQYFQYGFWKVYVNKKHKTITTKRQLIPFFFVIYILAGFLLSLACTSISVFYFIGVAAYLLAVLLFSMISSKKVKHIFGVALAFIILHLSYGSGYLYGCIHFLLFNKKPPGKLAGLTR